MAHKASCNSDLNRNCMVFFLFPSPLKYLYIETWYNNIVEREKSQN